MENPEETSSDTHGKLDTKGDDDSTPKSLSDMPTDTLVEVIDQSDYRAQMILRKVSKPLRSLVDEQKPNCKSISISYRHEQICCTFDTRKVRYQNRGYVYPLDDNDKYKKARVIRNDNYKEMAFGDWKLVLNNSKLKLDYFGFKTDNSSNYRKYEAEEKIWTDGCYTEMECFLESLNQQVSTKTFYLDTVDPLHTLRFLPYFKPGFLEKIIIGRERGQGREWNTTETLEVVKEISEIEQWKQAVELELQYIYEFPMEYAAHFKQFCIQYVKMKVDVLKKLGEIFSKLDNFEQCLAKSDFETLDKYIYREVGVDAPPNELTEYVRYWPIPESDDYLEFQFFEYSVLIEKKNKLIA